MYKRLIVVFICLSLFFTTGCWDAVELDQRAFVSTIVIDVNEKALEERGSEQGENIVFNEDMPQRLKITFGVILPSKLQGGEEAYFHRTVEAATLAGAAEKMNNESSRRPFFGHIRLVVLTEKLLEHPEIFMSLLDGLQKSPNVNQVVNVVAFRGNVEEFYKAKPSLESLIAQYVSGILDGAKVTSNIVSVNLAQFLACMRTWKGKAVLPLVEEFKHEEESKFKIEKAVLIKDFKMNEVLDSKYINTYKIMNKELGVGRKDIKYDNMLIPYNIFTSKRDIEVEEKDGRLKFNVSVYTEGDIKEVRYNQDVFNTNILKEIENTITKSMEQEFMETTEYFQNVIGSDYLGFEEYTKKYKNKLYKKYEENWDEAFRNAEISYRVNVDIRRIGAARN